MKHTLSVLVENKPGVLARVSGLFGRRGFNIDSLAVGPTDDERLSRMTIVIDGETHSLEQVAKQLHKLINVIKINDLDPSESIERELMLIRVSAQPAARAEIVEIANIFRAKIVDVAKTSMTIEVTGTAEKTLGLLDLLRPYGIKELVRTGKIALARGSKEEK
jgi:acetolactate synthase-1/3 small subunit